MHQIKTLNNQTIKIVPLILDDPRQSYGFTLVVEAVDSHPEFKCLINVDLGDSTSKDSPYSYKSATFEYGQHVLEVSSEA